VPQGSRTSPTTLEEVRALRALADRLGAVLGVSASLARSRAREIDARTEVERLGAETRRLEVARDRDAGRLLALSRMLERPARVAAYSPAARAAVEQLERLGQAGRPITLLSAPGVDAVAWAALAHVASERRTGPLCVVDGPAPGDHELERWRDPERSPLAAASGGSLVIIDAHALPSEVQSYLGAALPDDVGLIVSVPATVDVLVASGQMNERLADRLGDRAVALPTLVNRAEDLRALALEHLARIAVRLGRPPLGLAPKALVALLDHAWPGNDAELYATLLKAALVTDGEVIGVKELGMAGLRR
jgi:DNA-binding NtrC family response regulator